MTDKPILKSPPAGNNNRSLLFWRIVAVIIMAFAAFGGWTVFPYRLNSVETRTAELSHTHTSDIKEVGEKIQTMEIRMERQEVILERIDKTTQEFDRLLRVVLSVIVFL